MNNPYIVIGGSAGSFQTIVSLVEAVPKDFEGTIILCLHRLKHVRSGFVEALSIKTNLPIHEPQDKELIRPGRIYLAPANYHLLVGENHTFSLSTAAAVNHSRPSIDLTFRTAAYFLREQVLGIVLSGANRDGALGLKAIAEAQGHTIVQDTKDAQVSAMPQGALSVMKPDLILTKDEIIHYISKKVFLNRQQPPTTRQ